MTTTDLTQAIDELKAAHADFAAGKLSPVAHGSARQTALIKAVMALAAQHGVQLKPIYAIDANGELSIAAKNDGSLPDDFCGHFGEAFSTLLNTHCRPRTGILPTATMEPGSGWCRVNHFDAERMVLAAAA